MQRFNIFNQIHKGLRVLLYDTATTLQQTDFSDALQCNIALEKVEKVLYMFKQHGKKEDDYILPLVKKIDAAMAHRFEEEHEIDETTSGHLKSMMNNLTNTTDAESRKEAGKNICYSFNDFLAFNLYHMNKEEMHINPLLWHHFTDDELRAVSQGVVEKISPEENAIASYWMMRGLSNNEIIEWLLAVKAGAPVPVFQGLMQIAEVELPSKRLKHLKEALTVYSIQ